MELKEIKTQPNKPANADINDVVYNPGGHVFILFSIPSFLIGSTVTEGASLFSPVLGPAFSGI